MHDVLTRRFRHYLLDKTAQVEASDRPGTRPALNAARDGGGTVRTPPRRRRGPSSPTRPTWWWSTAASPRSTPPPVPWPDLGIDDVYVVGLAKRLEEVWLPDSDFPVILPRTSQGLYLLQRIRDEAHRFAISFHRQKRGKAMTVSALDGVPGLGESKRKALLAHFGSVKEDQGGHCGGAHGSQGHRPGAGGCHRHPFQLPTARGPVRGCRSGHQHDHRRNPGNLARVLKLS